VLLQHLLPAAILVFGYILPQSVAEAEPQFVAEEVPLLVVDEHLPNQLMVKVLLNLHLLFVNHLVLLVLLELKNLVLLHHKGNHLQQDLVLKNQDQLQRRRENLEK
jgi:hypothetical protein